MIRPVSSLLLTVLLLVGTLRAQDSAGDPLTPPSYTPTFTETPTLTETPALTSTPAEMPSLTPTETPSATPTFEITLTPTPSPTDPPAVLSPSATFPASPTLAPTAPAVLESSLRFTFDDGSAPGWIISPGATLTATPEGLGLLLPANAALTSEVSYGQGTVEARLLLASGQAQLYTRQSVSGGYLVTLDAAGSAALYRGGQLVTAGQSAPSPDGWWNLAFTAVGSDLRLTVNGLPVLAALDVSPLPPGTITLLSSDGLLVEWLSVVGTSLVASADLVAPLSVPAESQPSVLPPEIAFMTASPVPPEMQAGMSAQIAVNGIPPGEPGGPNCSWVYLYAANAAELITAYGQSGACAVIWLTGVDYLFDTNAPYGTYDLFRLNGQNIWIIRDEALGPAALRVGPNVTVFPRLFYVDTNSQLTLINVNVDNFGVAGTARGGAIYSDNIVRLYRTTFTNNRAADGGAVGSLGILKIWNSTFANNRSLYGGAVSNVKYNLFPSQVGIMTARCVTFQGNSADYGGAVVVSGGATTTITNSNFISNNNPDGLSRAYYSGPTNPTADLTNNWWNSPYGPDVGGQTVSGPANTAGFLSALVDIDACPRPAELVIPQSSSPTPTPTPTMSPAAQYYQQFRGVMFWAIYNETNENQQIPLFEALPGVDPGISNSITDRDHRYLMARTMLSNIPLDDVSGGMGYMQSWGGSIGNKDYHLWASQGNQVQCFFAGQPVAMSYESAAVISDSELLRWFNGYMECFRSGQPLAGVRDRYDNDYVQINGFIDVAIADHLNGAANPAPGTRYVKHTSTCFVWQRDPEGRITSCFGDLGKINMREFCQQAPVGRVISEPNRNCRASSINPSNIDVQLWLNSSEAAASNQQLGLETIVGTRNLINLGFYIPDQPLPGPSSGQGCETNCYFLIGNPLAKENGHLRQSINDDSRQTAWDRHKATQTNPDYGYRGNATSYFVYVLRIEPYGAETWITTVFQQGAN